MATSPKMPTSEMASLRTLAGKHAPLAGDCVIGGAAAKGRHIQQDLRERGQQRFLLGPAKR